MAMYSLGTCALCTRVLALPSTAVDLCITWAQDEEDEDEGGEGGEQPGMGEVRTGADADAGEDAREEGLHPQAHAHTMHLPDSILTISLQCTC